MVSLGRCQQPAPPRSAPLHGRRSLFLVRVLQETLAVGSAQQTGGQSACLRILLVHVYLVLTYLRSEDQEDNKEIGSYLLHSSSMKKNFRQYRFSKLLSEYMQDVVTEYCLHCAWFQNHVLHSAYINKVGIANHPILSARFYFSNLLKTMVLEKKNVTLFPLFEMPLMFLIAFKYIFLYFSFNPCPFHTFLRERWEIRNGRQNGIFQSNREFECRLPRQQVWCSQNVIQMPCQYLLQLHIILRPMVHPDMLRAV